MKHTLYLPLLLISAVLANVACRGDATSPLTEILPPPPTSEILPVSVQTRLAIPGEAIPTVRISGGQGSITIRVTTLGMCATIVDAGIRRAPHELAIVTHVSPSPTALCIAIVQAEAADYQGTITSLTEGSYRVRVFEGLFGATPRLIGSAVVNVSRPAT